MTRSRDGIADVRLVQWLDERGLLPIERVGTTGRRPFIAATTLDNLRDDVASNGWRSNLDQQYPPHEWDRITDRRPLGKRDWRQVTSVVRAIQGQTMSKAHAASRREWVRREGDEQWRRAIGAWRVRCVRVAADEERERRRAAWHDKRAQRRAECAAVVSLWDVELLEGCPT